MTAQTTPPDDANLAAAGLDNTDLQAPIGTCPLTKDTVQLIPLRYGLVQHHSPLNEVPLKNDLKSRPVGVRLMRDGYLYIVDERTGYLHEYKITAGQANKLLWTAAESSSDSRSNTVNEPIVFCRNSTLSAAYSEIQWTARKCSAVLSGEKERAKYMQRVSLAGQQGGEHLLTRTQAEEAIAEVAESANPRVQALLDGANPEQAIDYIWEDQPLFCNTQIGQVASQVTAEYQCDHLFLIVRDDIGILRDLRAYQEKVVDWIGEWSASDDDQHRYIIASYLHSLYAVDERKVRALATADPRYQALMGETTEEQREKIYAYLEAVQAHGEAGAYGEPDDWELNHDAHPSLRPTYEMLHSLGPDLYQRHRQAIASLRLESWRELNGRAIGERGIDQLVTRSEMEAFLEKHQSLLSHWQALLIGIREDRLYMLGQGLFHQAAWFYDFNNEKQIQERLETEFACVKELCGTEEEARKLAQYLDQNMLTLVTGLDTLSLDEQQQTKEQLANYVKLLVGAFESPGSIKDINALANQFNSLVSSRLPNFARLQDRFESLQTLLDHAYSPASQLEMASEWERVQRGFSQGEAINPNEFIRNSGPASRLRLLRNFATSGLTVRVSSTTEVEAYLDRRDRGISLRTELSSAYVTRKTILDRQVMNIDPPGSEALIDERITRIKSQLSPLESWLTNALSAVGGTPGTIGLVVEGMDEGMATEIRNAARDFRHVGTVRTTFSAAAGSRGNQIASVIFLFQLSNLNSALSDLLESRTLTKEQFLGCLDALIYSGAAGSSAIQGMTVSVLQSRLAMMRSAAGKINAMSQLGWWSGKIGFFAFGFGGAAAAADTVKHASQWGEAMSEGNRGALLASTMQIAGDATLLGTNVWAFHRTRQIVLSASRQVTPLRAFAWSGKSSLLIGVAARANLIGLVGTALQLVGEGLYNYLNLNALKSWMQAGVWGLEPQVLSLRDDWLALARAIQQPLCQLRHEGESSELLLTWPGVSTAEVDDRQVALRVYQQIPRPPTQGQFWPSGNVQTDLSGQWAGRANLVSKGEEALVVSLPIMRPQLTNLRNMVIVASYQLDDDRAIVHDTAFVIRNTRISRPRGRVVRTQGTFLFKAEKEISGDMLSAQPRVLSIHELAAKNVQ